MNLGNPGDDEYDNDVEVSVKSGDASAAPPVINMNFDDVMQNVMRAAPPQVSTTTVSQTVPSLSQTSGVHGGKRSDNNHRKSPSYYQTLKMNASTSPSISNRIAIDIHKQARFEELEEDKSLIELLSQLDDFVPIIPNELLGFYMTKAGLDCDDARIKKLLALITQKYLTDIAQDALQYCRIRNSGSHKDKKVKDKKLVLTTEDLSLAMGDYGITLKKPPYYR